MKNRLSRYKGRSGPQLLAVLLAAASIFLSTSVGAQGYGFAAPGNYGVKIYKTDYTLYPFVQVYLRTFDSQMQPLVNLNEMNVGLMVKGRPYDPLKRQFGIQSIRKREEATRSVIVVDASKSMAGKPFDDSRRAAVRFIESKRPQDEVAILAIRDTKNGFDLVSEFERDGTALVRRLNDIKPDGLKTRLFDTIGAAMQMCAMSGQGSVRTGHYIVSCSILVMSDGKDEESSIRRDELMTRISNLEIPIPIYSLAYSKIDQSHFKNLEALSKNSFGIYYVVGETTERMQRIVEQVQNIIQSDYVITFRSYIEPDGERHNLKVGIEFPSGSGKYMSDDTYFEAIQPPPIAPIQKALKALNQKIPPVPSGNPYWETSDSAMSIPTGTPAQ
ncbi:von Willebrand factor type A [Thiorhodococcus drewsii AZ1]|uniref:von Willebrand factor type A n=1 Tax=Thiorhodococcus drewsii AZ1 TaxID=765913 RepID=G2E4P9_9GAMM|nr:vWA domain-containing protein [Thiorhodococcus drewsii]EGV29525.1 von Willebrand factor type A [Thiorhodococcus drewsii AZ1]